MSVAIIGGTGIYSLGGEGREESVETPYGRVSITRFLWEGREILFLPRHGGSHGVPPHQVNYRANLKALEALGAEAVLATVAVGSMRPDLRPGELVLLGDFLDFTRSRVQTFHEGEAGVAHVSMAEPYCPRLRKSLKVEAARMGLELRPEAVYVCTEGPRFETAAEIRFFQGIGGDVVGMTNVPEVVLAKELGLCYAAVGIVTNMATGMESVEASGGEILQAAEDRRVRIGELFGRVFASLGSESGCDCRNALLRL